MEPSDTMITFGAAGGGRGGSERRGWGGTRPALGRPPAPAAVTSADGGPPGAGPDDGARALLAAERAAVAARLAAAQVDVGRIIGAGQDVATDDEHDPEGIGLALERAHAVAALERAREQLARIQDAQDRLARGEYGRCAVCGRRIPAERLQALPTATTCTTCSPVRRRTTRRGT